MNTAHPEWFFSAPMGAIAARRSDPLGFSGFAESMADELAPGLSNRTIDGRWISILCWILKQANLAWSARGTNDDSSNATAQEAAKELYTWVRPLELLWVARTVALTGGNGRGRQLPGIQAVGPWADKKTCSQPRLGLSADSYQRYRFSGVYGAYRATLRSLPGLTKDGDGWRLDELGQKLAELVPAGVNVPRAIKGPKPTPESYWLKSFLWRSGSTSFLPTAIVDPRKLPKAERDLLACAIFSAPAETESFKDAARRRRVAELLGTSSATTMPALFAHVARGLRGEQTGPELALLSPFCALAEAGVGAMNAIWSVVASGNKTGTGSVTKADVLENFEVRGSLTELIEAAGRWNKDSSSHSNLPKQPTDLASAILGARRSQAKQLEALHSHHWRFGGGLKWFAIEGDNVKSLAPSRGGAASNYSYRIGALGRLAVQCGIINELPMALRSSAELSEAELSEKEGA